MKLFIEYKKNDTGKSKFIQRLIPELRKIDVVITSNPNKADIVLCLNYIHKKYNCPIVLRVDGIHLTDTKANRWKNNNVKKGIKKANAVIWQSKFAKRMLTGILKVKPRQEFVIWNGANVKTTSRVQTEHKYNILIAAKWFRSNGKERKHKRLGPMLEIAKQYCKRRKDVCFWVAGNAGKYEFKHDRTKFLDWLPDDKLSQYIASMQLMLYLAAYDWMPNIVIECLAAGVPVLCGNNGGHAEVCPYIVDIDKPIESKYLTKADPPKIDYDKVLKKIDYVLDAEKDDDKIPYMPFEGIFISTIARQYKEAFKRVLRKA